MLSTKKLLENFQIEKNFNLISLPTITLSPEEADRFIDYLVDQSVMKQFARVERMVKPEKQIAAIGFGSGRFLYPSTQFNEAKYKKQFIEQQITLRTQELRGCVPIFDKDLEDIARTVPPETYKDNLMKLVAKKMSNELEEAYWIGETAGLNAFSADDIRGLWDGWRYRIINAQLITDPYYNKVSGPSHVLNACEGGTSLSPFRSHGTIAEKVVDESSCCTYEFKYHHMLKAMPSQYKIQGLANFAFINSDLVTQDFLEALSARATNIGDSVFTGAITPQYGRVKILDAPLMAHNLGDPTAAPSTDGVIGAGEYTDVLLTPKDNLIIGIQLDITIESQREAADRATYVFYTMRVCPAIENVNACVLLRCLEHRC